MNNAGTPESIGRMLLVSPSSLTMYQVAKSAHRFAMSVEICTNARTALDLVNRQKFDAVTVDLSLGHLAVTILERCACRLRKTELQSPSQSAETKAIGRRRSLLVRVLC